MNDVVMHDLASPQTRYSTLDGSGVPAGDGFSSGADIPPERRLMIAILRDAMRCVEKYRRSRDGRGRRLYEQEAKWILSEDTSWLHAFCRVCETLGLDPDAVRRSLRVVADPAIDSRPRRANVIDLKKRRLPC
jgi:hypothetical protein